MDVELAQQQVEKARDKINHCHLEMEVIKSQIVGIMEQLRLSVMDYDRKMGEVVSAESDLAKWRVTLLQSGFCELSFHSYNFSPVSTSRIRQCQ